MAKGRKTKEDKEGRGNTKNSPVKGHKGQDRSSASKILSDHPRAASPGKEQVEIIIRRKLLGEAPSEKHFIVSDGRKLKNVKELIDALETMGDDVFSLHVNEFKNDFAVWLRDVFSYEGMAQELERTRHRLEAQRVLMKSLINEIEHLAK